MWALFCSITLCTKPIFLVIKKKLVAKAAKKKNILTVFSSSVCATNLFLFWPANHFSQWFLIWYLNNNQKVTRPFTHAPPCLPCSQHTVQFQIIVFSWFCYIFLCNHVLKITKCVQQYIYCTTIHTALDTIVHIQYFSYPKLKSVTFCTCNFLNPWCQALYSIILTL